jgi:glycosyltransferase involved in cell wall biosynthesis
MSTRKPPSILLMSSEFPPRRGGIGAYSRELAQAAVEMGYSVTVAAADYGADQSELDRQLPFEVLRFRGQPHTMQQLPAKIAFVNRLARRRPEFDIVHAADWPFYIPLALSRYRRTARCLLTFHGTEVNFMQNPKRALLLRALGFWNGWAELVGNSAYTAQALEKAFQLPTGAAKPIGLGVARRWLEAPVDREGARQRHGFSADRFVIASLGRVVPRKGHLVLAEALANIDPDIARKLTWIIMGPPSDPDYAAEVERRAAKLPVQTLIKGTLPEAEVQDLLSASDLFCLPGFIDETGAVEGFGLVYLEAAALGVPSVASASGGVPDAVLDGRTGLLTQPNNPAAVASAITRLYRDRQLLAQLAVNARAHAQTATWQSVALSTYGAPSTAHLAAHELSGTEV